MFDLGIEIYAFELFLARLAGLVVLSGLVCFRETHAIIPENEGVYFFHKSFF